MSYLYQKRKNKSGSPTSFWRYDMWKSTRILRNWSSSFNVTSTSVGAKLFWTNHRKQACIAEVYFGWPIQQIYSTFEVPYGKTES